MEQPREQLHQPGLAAARIAHEPDALPRADLEADVVHRVEPPGADREAPLQALHIEEYAPLSRTAHSGFQHAMRWPGRTSTRGSGPSHIGAYRSHRNPNPQRGRAPPTPRPPPR